MLENCLELAPHCWNMTSNSRCDGLHPWRSNPKQPSNHLCSPGLQTFVLADLTSRDPDPRVRWSNQSCSVWDRKSSVCLLELRGENHLVQHDIRNTYPSRNQPTTQLVKTQLQHRPLSLNHRNAANVNPKCDSNVCRVRNRIPSQPSSCFLLTRQHLAGCSRLQDRYASSTFCRNRYTRWIPARSSFT